MQYGCCIFKHTAESSSCDLVIELITIRLLATTPCSKTFGWRYHRCCERNYLRQSERTSLWRRRQFHR